MPDDLPDGRALDDLTIDELAELRDRAHARAERYDILAGKLDRLIAEHEDDRAERQARERRATFRLLKGGALGVAIVWLLRRTRDVIQAHPVAASGTVLGIAALATGITLAIQHFGGQPRDDAGPRPPATGRPTVHPTVAPSPSPSESTTPPQAGSGGTPGEPPTDAPSPPPGSPAGPAEPVTDETAPGPTTTPDNPGGADDDSTDEPTADPTIEPTVEPAPDDRSCVLGLDLEPLLDLCLLGHSG